MKNAIPKKIPVLFSRPKKIAFGQNVRLKKILRTPPSLKYVSGAPGGETVVPGEKPLGEQETTKQKV